MILNDSIHFDGDHPSSNHPSIHPEWKKHVFLRSRHSWFCSLFFIHQIPIVSLLQTLLLPSIYLLAQTSTIHWNEIIIHQFKSSHTAWIRLIKIYSTKLFLSFLYKKFDGFYQWCGDGGLHSFRIIFIDILLTNPHKQMCQPMVIDLTGGNLINRTAKYSIFILLGALKSARKIFLLWQTGSKKPNEKETIEMRREK